MYSRKKRDVPKTNKRFLSNVVIGAMAGNRKKMRVEQHTRPPGHQTAGSPGHRTAGSPGHWTAGLPGHQTASSPGHRTAGSPGHRVPGHRTAGSSGHQTAGSSAIGSKPQTKLIGKKIESLQGSTKMKQRKTKESKIS